MRDIIALTIAVATAIFIDMCKLIATFLGAKAFSWHCFLS